MGKELMDILILSPPDFLYRRQDEPVPMYGEERNIPYGAMTVASYLVHHGLRAMVAPLREYYQETDSYTYFDDDTEESAQAFRKKTEQVLGYLLKRLHPRTVGLAVNYAIHHQATETLVDLLRELAPELPVLIGGNHATHTAEHWLSRKNPVDFVILGEGEHTCLKLLKSGLSPGEIPGVGLRRVNGSIEIRDRPRPLSEEQISIPVNLSLLALPRWAPLTTQRHWISLSRGCNWRCNFCTTPSMWGRQRYRNSEAVAAEIELVTRTGVNDMFFAEDMLNPTSPRFRNQADVLRQFSECHFSTMTRLDLMDRAEPKRVRAANIEHVFLGMESFSKELTDAMGKRVRLKKGRDVALVLERLRSAGLQVTLFMLVGHPESSYRADMHSAESCLQLARRGLVNNILPFFFIPIPGTAAAAMMRRGRFKLLEPKMNHWTTWQPVIEILGPSGAVTYSAAEMQRVMKSYHDIWRSCRLGVFAR